MSTLETISLLFLLICFINIVDSVSPFLQYSTHVQPDPIEKLNNDTNINVLFLSVANDLPLGSERLYFSSNFERDEYLVQGNPLIKVTNFEVKDCTMIWGVVCAQFILYDPRTEGNHQQIYWSARKDGVYHSWDNVRWDKRVNWQHVC